MGFHMTQALPAEKLGRTKMSEGQSGRVLVDWWGDKGGTVDCVCVCVCVCVCACVRACVVTIIVSGLCNSTITVINFTKSRVPTLCNGVCMCSYYMYVWHK